MKKEMTKAIKLKVLVVLMMAALQLSATSPATFRVYSIGDKKVNVHATDMVGKTIAYIIDQHNEVIYKKRYVAESEVGITFDFSSAKTGEYRIVVEDNLKSFSMPLIVSDDQIEANKDKIAKTYFPQLIHDDGMVIVKLLADESNDLLIDIKDKNGVQVYREEIDGKQGLIGKRFQFLPGEYDITLSSNSFSKTKHYFFK